MTDNTCYRTLADREQFRDAYNRTRDPIRDDRLLWRAQTFRHLVHLVPGQTILELGCGAGDFTQQLLRVSRGENPITAVTFLQGNERPKNLPAEVEFFRPATLSGALGRISSVFRLDLFHIKRCDFSPIRLVDADLDLISEFLKAYLPKAVTLIESPQGFPHHFAGR